MAEFLGVRTFIITDNNTNEQLKVNLTGLMEYAEDKYNVISFDFVSTHNLIADLKRLNVEVIEIDED